MERLFSPSTPFRYGLVQELNLHVSTEELLSADRAFTYGDLYTMLGNETTGAWLTPHALIAREGAGVSSYWPCRLRFSADDAENILAFSRSPEHLLEICDVVLRLLAASVVHSVTLDTHGSRDSAFISAPPLAYLLEQCQSLKSLTLVDLALDENHCRVLGDDSKPGLEIELEYSKLTNAGTSALAEVLGRNRGPTTLYYVLLTIPLADGLRGNTRLKSFQPRISSNRDDGKRELLALAGGLKENKGLVELDLNTDGFRGNNETWGAICDSLKTHPTLEILNLRSAFIDAAMAPAVIKSRIQALVDMITVNISIHTIYVDSVYSEHELFRGSVIPHLETNRLRPRLLAIQRTRPIAYRAKVLGQALLAARNNANRFWMLLSGNAEVAFLSTTATATPAANLATPAAAEANSSEFVAAVAASVVSNLMTTATDCPPIVAWATVTSAVTPSTNSASGVFGPSVCAATNVATPSVGQKSKAYP
jgi:hypothetical protein